MSMSDSERTCLQLARITGAPLLDPSGTFDGLLDESGLLNEKGREIADRLIKGEDPQWPPTT